MKIKNSKALKQHNQYAILTEIIDNQPISRSDLTKNLDVSHTTVSYLVKDLMKKGLIVESYSDSTGGRPPKLLHFKGDNKYIISLSFEDKIIRFSIFNLNYELVDKTRITVLKDPFRKILNKLDNLTKDKLQENDINENQIYGVGVSVPGIYKKDKDLIISSTAKYLDNIPLRKKLKGIYDYTDIYIENDANLAVYYEWSHKLDKEYNNIIYIYVVDGIGSGIIVENNLYTGSHGNAGEIGHMKVKSKGKKCICGGIGCLETISSVRAIEDDFNEALYKGEESKIEEMFEPTYDYKKIVQAYIKGDPLSKKILNNAIKYFIRALSSIINIFDPQIIVLGGLFDEFNDEMIRYVNNELEKTYFPDKSDRPEIISRREEKNYQLTAITAYVFDQWKANI